MHLTKSFVEIFTKGVPVAEVLRAASFNQSIGINTHLTATSSAYGNVVNVIADIKYLNVTHVRDRIIDTPYQAPFVALGKAGLKFDLLVGGDPLQAITPLRALAPYLDSIEGPNEVDRSVFSYDGYTGVASALAIQKDLYTSVHADSVLSSIPVLAFSLAFPTDLGFLRRHIPLCRLRKCSRLRAIRRSFALVSRSGHRQNARHAKPAGCRHRDRQLHHARSRERRRRNRPGQARHGHAAAGLHERRDAYLSLPASGCIPGSG